MWWNEILIFFQYISDHMLSHTINHIHSNISEKFLLWRMILLKFCMYNKLDLYAKKYRRQYVVCK